MISLFIFIAIAKLHRCLNVRPGYSRNPVGGPPDCSPGTIPDQIMIPDPFAENLSDMEQVQYAERPYFAYLEMELNVLRKA